MTLSMQKVQPEAVDGWPQIMSARNSTVTSGISKNSFTGSQTARIPRTAIDLQFLDIDRTKESIELPKALTSREDQEFQEILELIGRKAAEKFTKARDVFRFVNGGRDGTIDREEMRYFFRFFNLRKEVADKFFERLDADNSGDVSYEEFLKYVWPYVVPGEEIKGQASPKGGLEEKTIPLIPADDHRNACWANDSEDAAKKRLRALDQVKGIKKELRDAMEDIERKLEQYFRRARDAFVIIDLSRDGKISREEMRFFFERFGWSQRVSDELFELLEKDEHGEVDYASFMALFGKTLGWGNIPAPRKPAVKVPHDRVLEREVSEIAAKVAAKLTSSFRNIREAFRSVDEDKTGTMCHDDVYKFFKKLCMPPEVAAKVLKALDRDGSGTIDFNEFAAFFDPESIKHSEKL